MSSTLQTGHQGESIAEEFLRNKGYEILERNWRYGKYEIDLIARDNGFLVIVEVKTRKSAIFGEPEVFVTRSKQRYLIEAANAYVRQHHLSWEVRFDIVSLIVHKGQFRINHIPNAFYPLL